MIWVTWRQHRIEALVAGIMLLIIAAVFLVSGLGLSAAYQQMGIASCVAQHASCDQAISDFENVFNNIFDNFGLSALMALPLLVGLFVGAPTVAREMEQGTFRLAWVQSIPRLRWLITKLVVLLAATLVVFFILSLLAAWWATPVNTVLGAWRIYDLEGVVPLAYALYALTFGIMIGAVVKRTLPAMALTILGFIVPRVAIEAFLRPNFMSALKVTWPFDQGKIPPVVQTSWVVSKGYIDQSGHVYSTPHDLFPLCIGSGITDSKAQDTLLTQCAQAHSIVHVAFYQPVERFWLFQSIESAIFLALTVIFLALTIWWVKRKIV